MNEFWKKFKHRNVAKVAAAYAALSWFLLQAQEAILPTIGAPTWVEQSILFLMLVGFPIACVIAWASDVNSKDDHFEEPEGKKAKIKPNSPQVLNYLAYGWLERDQKLDQAMQMLQKAYKASAGWRKPMKKKKKVKGK